ncbi:MAG TPA: protein kinase [Polyangia bacterium]|nr:protein kinase [Polyangia bacterium]
MRPFPPPLAINQTVGNYRIAELLGRGGMGAVYMAEHPGIGRKVAVKVLHPALADNEREVARFVNEARAANAIRHPGIVQIFDFGTLPTGATYIIMELLEGESLGARLKRLRKLPLVDAVDLVARTAEILGAAHAAGIVHRDLKPDNLFLVPDPREGTREGIKVLDFGIAKLTHVDPGGMSLKTRSGFVVGTPRYMAPEQCRGARDIDQRADVYALGVILFELVCGRRPFVSDGHGELIHMHVSTPPPRPRKVNAAIPAPLEGVILNALEKDPRMRVPTMDALREALRAIPVEVLAAADAMPASALAPANDTGPSGAATPYVSTDEGRALSTVRRRSPWVAPIVGLTVAAAVFVVGLSRRYAPPSGTPALAETAAVVSPPTVVTPAVAAPAPRMIAIGIASDPPGARIVREGDGADVGVTPMRASWPAGEGVERLGLELPGFRREPLVIPRDRDVSLSLHLSPVAPPAPARKPHPAARRPRAADDDFRPAAL